MAGRHSSTSARGRRGRHRKPAPAHLRRAGVLVVTGAAASGIIGGPSALADTPTSALQPAQVLGLQDLGLPLTNPGGAEPEAPAAESLPSPGPAQGAPSTPPPPAAEPAPQPAPAPAPPAPSQGERVLQEAARHAGTPYQYGGSGPRSFDCSGFTSYVYRQIGVQIPRTSQSQRDATRWIPREQAQPGDLIFFGGKRVYHVAIYAGDGRMWTAPETGDVVKLAPIYDSFSVGRP